MSKPSQPTASTRIDLRTLSMVLILVVMWLFFRWRVGDFYFGGESIAKLTRDMATWTILAAGMTLVIVAGHIDLSVGSLLALCAATCAYIVDPEFGLGMSAGVAVPAALLVGLLIGLWQGALTAYLRIPAFIVTLGGLFIFRGLTIAVSARDPRVPDDSWVLLLGFNNVPKPIGWALAILACLTIAYVMIARRIRRTRRRLPVEAVWMIALKVVVPAALILAFVNKVNAPGAKGIPYQTLVMVSVLLVLWFIASQTRFGRHVFAVGGNREAARLSGISVEKTTVVVFGIMGLLAGLAGVVWMAQNQGSTKNAGQWYELYAIAACVIGGSSLMGGRGSVFGTCLGALVMATVIQGMDYTDLQNWVQLVVRGSVLVLAVAIDIATKDPPPWMQHVRQAMRFKRQDAK